MSTTLKSRIEIMNKCRQECNSSPFVLDMERRTYLMGELADIENLIYMVRVKGVAFSCEFQSMCPDEGSDDGGMLMVNTNNINLSAESLLTALDERHAKVTDELAATLVRIQAFNHHYV